MLDLPSMNYRQKRGDLIKLSKIALIQISLTLLHFHQQLLLGVIASNYLNNSQDYKINMFKLLFQQDYQYWKCFEAVVSEVRSLTVALVVEQ